MKTKSTSYRIAIHLLLCAMLLFLSGGFLLDFASAQENNPNPPAEVTRLIFIHHSSGENWLTDGNGDLGIALSENNYFVSDTNYGWGPDGIGDRTDIVNWPEWFTGPESPRYLSALYSESGQNSSYTRTLSDPGGENQVILFKSCFPNSNLDGNPDDLPAPGEGLTVGNAKAIYNELLTYFVTRPDKLFILITAPPVQDPAYAGNARAFNTWLVQDWLRENNYPLNNVAVWDFYNVLTQRDNHHRFLNGQVEYVSSHGKNTSAYATGSDDDHPSSQGNRKATEEFVPMLNLFYHRWKSSAPESPTVQPTVSEPEPTQPPAEQATPADSSPGEPSPGDSSPALASDLVDDMESGVPVGSQGWQAYGQDNTATTITCAPEGGTAYSGAAALAMNFSVVPDSWATCTLLYDQNRDWRSASGLTFQVHASQPGLLFDLIAYGGSPAALEGYQISLETTQEMVDGWAKMDLSWESILRPAWEANPGSPFHPGQVAGIGFGFNTPSGETRKGQIWIDEIRLAGAAVQPSQAGSTEVAVQEPVEPVVKSKPVGPDETKSKGTRSCLPAFALALAVIGLWVRRRRG